MTEALQGLGGYHANTTMAKLPPPNFGMVDPDTNLFAPIGKILQEKINEPISSSKL